MIVLHQIQQLYSKLTQHLFHQSYEVYIFLTTPFKAKLGKAAICLKCNIFLYQFLLWMRGRKVVEPQVVDQNYLNSIYQNILDKIGTLDKLNEDYKVRQEEHFLRTFMNVLEKMGNDLIIAQEAYRNIDIEVKRDEYCVSLATELNFFKGECFALRAQLKKAEQEVTSARFEKENTQEEMASLRLSYEKKMKECQRLTAENKQLKKQLKLLSKPSIFKYMSLTPETEQLLADPNTKKDSKMNNYLEGKINPKRGLITSEGKRIANLSVSIDKRRDSLNERDDKTPKKQAASDFETMRKNLNSTHASFRRRSFQNSLSRNPQDELQSNLKQ